MALHPPSSQTVFFQFICWNTLNNTPPYTFFGKKHFGMMNMQCIDDALSRWNVGEGHIRHTRSHHSPAKLTWWSPLLDNPYNNAPYWSLRVLCVSKHHKPILKMTVQVQGSILYCIKLRIHGTSSSVLPNCLLPIHMLEYVEQHPTLYIFRKKALWNDEHAMYRRCFE